MKVTVTAFGQTFQCKLCWKRNPNSVTF